MIFRCTGRRRSQQAGYVLLAILFALTLMVIGLAIAAPRAAVAVQRTKEGELIRRGEQYALGIRRFYKKFGRYPSSIDQLENTNNIRFLRRRYLDPLTGKDDWTPIQYGQARPALGFFGQKVINVGGVNPSGPGLGPSTTGTGLGTSNSSSTFGSGNSGFGSSSFGSSASGSSSNSSSASSPNPNGTSATDSTNSTGAGSTNPNNPSNPTGTAGNPISGDQLSGRTFGGGAIVGVSVPSQKQSLKEFQQQDHYKDWQFVYDPTMDPTLRGMPGVGGATGIPGATGIGLPTNPGGGLNPLSPNTTTNPTGTQSNPTTAPSTGTGTPPQNPQ